MRPKQSSKEVLAMRWIGGKGESQRTNHQISDLDS